MGLPTWIWGKWQAVHTAELALPAPEVPAPRRGKHAVVEPASAKAGAGKLDWRPLVVLLVTAVTLTLQEYFGSRKTFAELFPAPSGMASYLKSDWELLALTWWSGWRVFGYLILPATVVLLMPGERLRDYGWSPKGFFRHLHIYVGLFALMIPLLLILSQTRAFQRIYPFYKLAHRSTGDLLLWELLYAAQFLSLEFFFRGFMLHGMKRALGTYAIWVMVVPYCMIHYGKTFAETMAAIIAGLVLGTISLRTNSIWGGFFIHVAVALSMDLLCLRYCVPGMLCPSR